MTGQPAAAAQDPPAPVIVLVRPQLGENVGAAARAMLNFGLTDLRLVRPQCGWPNVKAVQAASGATEVLNRLRVFERVEDATGDLQRLYATTARPRDLSKPVVTAAAGRARSSCGAAPRRAGRHPVRTRAHRAVQRRSDLCRRGGQHSGQSGLLLAQPRSGGAAGRLRVVSVGGGGRGATGGPAGRAPGGQRRARNSCSSI